MLASIFIHQFVEQVDIGHAYRVAASAAAAMGKGAAAVKTRRYQKLADKVLYD
jgi:hypothetical protein